MACLRVSVEINNFSVECRIRFFWNHFDTTGSPITLIKGITKYFTLFLLNIIHANDNYQSHAKHETMQRLHEVARE